MKKLKIPILYLLSLFFSIGPVLIYFLVNLDRYVQTAPQGIKVSCGFGLLFVIAFLKVMGKLKIPSRIYVFAIIFLLSYLLKDVLKDLIVFSFLALIGEMLDGVCQGMIKKARVSRTEEKTAQKTAQEIERVLSGRV